MKHLLAAALAVALIPVTAGASEPSPKSGTTETIYIESFQFRESEAMSAPGDSGQTLEFRLKERDHAVYSQQHVSQSQASNRFRPNAETPFFFVHYALPVPPCYTREEAGQLAGLDQGVFWHNHSPGFEVLPNGDALAIYFSTPIGLAEADPKTSFMQARLRRGALEWDMPEQFFYTEGYNDQSGLLWTEGDTIRFFGGGRAISDYVPFRLTVSTDNGATWQLVIPQLDSAATRYTAQPVTNAFRGGDGAMYMVMDGKGAESFLWRSPDGIHWSDMGGRTSTRHSTIVPLDDKGRLMAVGGKNNNVDGWNPVNLSSDYGKTWSEPVAGPFPPNGTAQRPSAIRLQSGRLLLTGDAYLSKLRREPPQGWAYGNDCFVALSDDNGQTWRIKPLPVQLPQHGRTYSPSLGYCTVRQAPDGTIHLLTSTNYPNLHYEFNEAWILSEAGETALNVKGAKTVKMKETYPDGRLKAQWSAHILKDGRYLLHGKYTDYHENGTKAHTATYANGLKTGKEAFYTPEGTLRSTWLRNRKTGHAVWTQYYEDGRTIRVVSEWNTAPVPRDLDRVFMGYEAEGPARHYERDGNLVREVNFHKGEIQTPAAE